MMLALGLAIIEMDYKFKFTPDPDDFELAPLWSNSNEVYYPQDIVGK